MIKINLEKSEGDQRRRLKTLEDSQAVGMGTGKGGVTPSPLTTYGYMLMRASSIIVY